MKVESRDKMNTFAEFRKEVPKNKTGGAVPNSLSNLCSEPVIDAKCIPIGKYFLFAGLVVNTFLISATNTCNSIINTRHSVRQRGPQNSKQCFIIRKHLFRRRTSSA